MGKRPNEKKCHDIFDVVKYRLGVDFEQAKLYIAELIRRPDLIQTKGNGTYQKTDANSLLSPTAANRDDGLIWT